MVIPVLVAEVDESEYPEGVPAWAYGEPVWQGAYVFHVSPDTGIDYYPFSIERSLYIGDVLYTISGAKIKMNNLENLDYINEVELPYSTWAPPEYPPEEPRSEEPAPDAQSGDEELLSG